MSPPELGVINGVCLASRAGPYKIKKHYKYHWALGKHYRVTGRALGRHLSLVFFKFFYVLSCRWYTIRAR